MLNAISEAHLIQKVAEFSVTTKAKWGEGIFTATVIIKSED